MAFKHLERFEREQAVVRLVEREREAKAALRKAVKDAIPRRIVQAAKRKPGRPAVGGISRKEVKALREKATKFLDGPAGFAALEAEVQHTALVIVLEDGVLGTEPWRAAGGPHGALVSANARVRYIENAIRLLEDMRRRLGMADIGQRLLEGVIDAETT